MIDKPHLNASLMMAWRFHPALQILILAVLYFGAGKFGLSLAMVNANASPVWPPSGLALAALLLLGNRLWPGVFIGAFLVNITTPGSSVTATLGIATGNTLEAVVGAVLVNRFANGWRVFEGTRDTFRFVFLAAILSTMVSATMGATLTLGDPATWSRYRTIWLTWWLGDLTSDLTVAPLLLVWWGVRIPPVKLVRIMEAIALLAITGLVSVIVFTDIIPFAYLTLLPLAWAVYRFGNRCALAVMVLLSGMALRSTLLGQGPFASADANKAVLYLQAFMGINSIMALALTAAIGERKKSEQRLEIQYAVTRGLAEARSLDEGIPKILQALGEAGGWDVGAMWRVDSTANELYCSAIWHRPTIAIAELEADIRQRRLPPRTCLPGQVWSSDSPVWVPDVAQRDNLPRAPILLRAGVHGAVCFPVKLDREILGVIECFSRRSREPDHELLQLLGALGRQTGQFIERQRASEAVQESEARFRQLAENIREVFWVSNVEKTRILYVSPGYEAIWGRPCASLYASAKNWLEPIHHEDRDRVWRAALVKQIAGDYDEEYRILRPDNSIRWVRDRAFPVTDGSGKIYRIVGIAEDITRPKEAEESLRESEARKRAIMESALDGILTIDAAGRVMEFNPAAENMFGCPRADVVGREFATLFIPAKLREWFGRGLAVQFISDVGPALGSRMEIIALRADGTEFPAEFTLTRSQLTDRLTFTLFIRDISKRKRTEEQIATLVHAVESTGEMICITDLEDRFVFANRAFLEAYGYRRSEILGQTPAILFSPSNPPGLLSEILSQTRLGGWRGEVMDRRKDGSEFPISLSTSVVRDLSGQVIGLMGVSQDITQRKRTEEQFRLLADAMQSAQEMISITDSENRFTFVNDAFLKTYGYTNDEVLGRTPHFLYASENPAGLCEEVYEQTVQGGWTGELLNCRKDGKILPISLSTSQIKGADGKVLGLAGFARDISERRRMEGQATAFAALGHKLSAAVTPLQAAEIILETASDLFGWEAGYVHLYSEKEDRIIPILTLDTINGQRVHVPPVTFTLDPSPLMRLVMQDGQQLVNRPAEQAPSVERVAFGDKTRRSNSMMYVPIPAKGIVLGVLSIQSYRPDAYGPQDLTILQSLAEYCGGALQRIRATEDLREAEANYRGIFENVTDGIFRTTPEGRFLDANPAAARMLGYESVVELIAAVTDVGRQTYVIPAQREEFKRTLGAKGSIQGFEAERYHRDGTKFWTSISARTVCGDDGQVLYYEGTYQDITERKRAESVMRDSEQRFRTLFESAPVGIALHDPNGRILETNQAYQQMVGYSGDELRELGVKRITLPEDVSEGDRLYHELLEGKCDHYQREKRFASKTGRQIWATSHATAVRDGEGRLRYIISLVEDITERMEAQKQLQELAAIVASSNDAILSTTKEGLIVSWNQAAERIYGYPAVEALGRPVVMLVPPGSAHELVEILLAVSQGKRIENFETVFQRKDGSLAEISLTISPVQDGTGKVTGASAIGRDIGPRKQLEREILEIGANERRRIGHDLHDGLGQILAGIALKTRALQDALVVEASSQVEESEQIVRLVNDSIRQTRTLARGLDPVDAEANGLTAALQSLAVQTEYLFRVECNYESLAHHDLINAPTGMALYRIAQEAIHNAVTHGHARQIVIRLEEVGDYLSLCIRDNGKGFKPDARSGSGMGLRIMQYRANSVGGRLSVHPSSVGGTEVECLVARRLCLIPKKETSKDTFAGK